MKVVITGGTGFIGRRIALRLLERGALAGPDGRDVAIDELVLFDVAPPQLALPEDRRLRIVTGEVSDAALMRDLITPGTFSVFHLAAIGFRGRTADAADLLRRPEGDRRAPGQRLQPQGLYRRPGAPAADHHRAA